MLIRVEPAGCVAVVPLSSEVPYCKYLDEVSSAAIALFAFEMEDVAI